MPIIVGIILLASAIVVAFDANRIQHGFTYGISPAAVPYVVAGFLGLLGISPSSRHFDPKPLKPDLRIETLSC
ncbi:hypothetical protein [Sinorhizobium meliloti]|uniref:hypothetical protein n=1 Tax=Rhizobium meliloti TaxID=382 RepID=UPI0002E4F4BF|nr:hypothetical protein [Sinorhizobium meliloti]